LPEAARARFLIDHAFASEGVLGRVGSFGCGDREEWCPPSDHVPLVVDLRPAEP
jgi:endonuclease/exonuclease/phosphatase family metal-dependent hydrolase